MNYILRNIGLNHLVVTGLSTLGSLEQLIRDATDQGLEVTVVQDAIAFETCEEFAFFLETMQRLHISVLETAELCAAVGSHHG